MAMWRRNRSRSVEPANEAAFRMTGDDEDQLPRETGEDEPGMPAERDPGVLAEAEPGGPGIPAEGEPGDPDMPVEDEPARDDDERLAASHTDVDAELEELSALAGDLLQQAAELRRHAQELSEVLDRGAPLEPEDEAPPPEQPRPARADEEVSGMRIVAVNMAAAGRTREEAAVYLRETFGEAPDPALLDEIFPD